MIITNFQNYQKPYGLSSSTQNKISLRNNTCVDTVSFTSNPKTLEVKMKRISGIHDPYSDIIMVSDDDFEAYQRKVRKRPNAVTMLNLLNSYDENLFEPEKEVISEMRELLKGLKQDNQKNVKSLDLSDLLTMLYPSAKTRLENFQLNKIDEIYEIIDNTKGDNNKILNQIFEPVKDDIKNNNFRISPLKNQLINTKGIDKNIKKRILDKIEELPNSRTSSEVFIINNINKSHSEIAEAFITPSRVSIEHIKPHSKGGASTPSNYLIASRRMNNSRSSIPFDKYIEQNPKMSYQIERYFRDLIKRINRGGIGFITPSINAMIETVNVESKGLVSLELSEDISENELKKSESMREQLQKLLDNFSK